MDMIFLLGIALLVFLFYSLLTETLLLSTMEKD